MTHCDVTHANLPLTVTSFLVSFPVGIFRFVGIWCIKTFGDVSTYQSLQRHSKIFCSIFDHIASFLFRNVCGGTQNISKKFHQKKANTKEKSINVLIFLCYLRDTIQWLYFVFQCLPVCGVYALRIY